MTVETGKRTRSRAWGILVATALVGAAGCAVEGLPSGDPEVASVPSSAPEQSLAQSNPTGSGESVSVTIDVALGGSVALSDGAEIVVPPGALPPGVETITVTSTVTPAPAEYETVSPVYHFEPDGAVFLVPLTVKLPCNLPAGASTDDFVVLWSRQRHEGYDMVPATFAAEGGCFASAEITHFSTGVVGKKYAVDPRPAPDPYGD